MLLFVFEKEVTRANKDIGWSLDTVDQINEVLSKTKDEITQSPQAGVYIYGLFLEGASWLKSSARLTEAKAKVLFEPLPVVHVSAKSSLRAEPAQKNIKPAKFVPQAVKAATKNLETYECPVFRKSRSIKQNYVTKFSLRSSVNPEKWILRGVRILCDKD